MQSSSRALPFKQTLAGASPATDAIVHVAQLDESATVRRWRSQVQFLLRTPVSNLPLCLSSHRMSFVNSHSSVRVRPEAPAFGPRCAKSYGWQASHRWLCAKADW